MTAEAAIIVGDMRATLADMPADSIDACVTDCPYELSFMGKKWDGTGISFDPATWAAVFRVLKPGSHLLCFGGTRTVHRIACAIEDAGFEIRTQIAWLYGTGFPKSLDVSKAIDRQRHDRSQVLIVTSWIAATRDRAGLANRDIDAAFGFVGMAGHWTSQKSQPSVPTLEQIPILFDLFGLSLDDVPAEIRELIWTLNGRKGQPGAAWFDREVIGAHPGDMGGLGGDRLGAGGGDITAPATEAAKQWQGWGTALKPAMEPIVVARKPLIGTVAGNVQEYGTGALNVDGCRVGTDDDCARAPAVVGDTAAPFGRGVAMGGNGHHAGRWPANVILDPAAARLLDLQAGDDVSRFFYVAKPDRRERDVGCQSLPAKTGAELTDRQPDTAGLQNPRAGAGRTSGGRNTHSTVKPVDLMRYLCRLVCPPGGTVLDPFAGSGTTGIAAHLEGFGFIGIELRAEAAQIARLRISATQRGELYVDKKTDKTEHRQATDNRQQGLFV